MGTVLSDLNKRQYSVEFDTSVDFKQMKAKKKIKIPFMMLEDEELQGNGDWFNWRCGNYKNSSNNRY